VESQVIGVFIVFVLHEHIVLARFSCAIQFTQLTQKSIVLL